jgi:hypothetical protein
VKASVRQGVQRGGDHGLHPVSKVGWMTGAKAGHGWYRAATPARVPAGDAPPARLRGSTGAR